MENFKLIFSLFSVTGNGETLENSVINFAAVQS